MILSDNMIICDSNNTDRRVWKVLELDERGQIKQKTSLFTFDKEKVYNIFQDYPQNFSVQEKTIFDEEYPFWAEYLSDEE